MPCVAPGCGAGVGQQGLFSAVTEKGRWRKGSWEQFPLLLSQLLRARGGKAFRSSVRASCREDPGFPGLCRPPWLRVCILPLGRATSWVPVPLTSCIPSRVRPSPKYVTLEQLKVMWGTSPVPTGPAPGLPPWAPASQDLVPTTCLPPALPSSSSFASVTPSPQVGGLCPRCPCGPLAAWLCLCVLAPDAVVSPPSASPRGALCARRAAAGWHRGWRGPCLWSGSCALFLFAFSVFVATVSHCVFFSLCSPFSHPPRFPCLPVSP